MTNADQGHKHRHEPQGKVLIEAGSNSTTTITVESDGHTQVFTVPQSPLVRREPQAKSA